MNDACVCDATLNYVYVWVVESIKPLLARYPPNHAYGHYYLAICNATHIGIHNFDLTSVFLLKQTTLTT